jgi:hypothetical protein
VSAKIGQSDGLRQKSSRSQPTALRPVMFDGNRRRNPFSWPVLQSFPNNDLGDENVV